jgi:hypothetical protein
MLLHRRGLTMAYVYLSEVHNVNVGTAGYLPPHRMWRLTSLQVIGSRRAEAP